MIPTKEMTPHVPVNPEETIEQVHEAWEMGITIAHLHARDEAGSPTWDPDIYRSIFEGVRKHCPGLVVCGSTSGRNFPELEKRSALIELMPDMCSLTLSSLNFAQHASVNAPDTIVGLLEKMNAWGVHPEFECFDLGMINYGKYLIGKGLAKGPHYWNILFGNIAGMQAEFHQMGAALNEIPEGHFVAFAGLGASQTPVMGAAIAQGLGVRIGLEDNIWYDRKKSTLATNITLLRRVHQLLEIHERNFMSPFEFGNYGFYNSGRDQSAGLQREHPGPAL